MTRLALATARVADARTRGNTQPVQPRSATRKPQAAKAFGAAINGANPGYANPQPAAAAPPAPQGRAWDSKASLEAGGAQRGYEESNTGLNSSEEQKKRYYGLDEGFTSPYSQASLLQRRHDVEQRGGLTNAGLNIYSGSTVNAHRNVDYRFNKDHTGLEESSAADMAQFARERKKAWDDYQEGLKGAEIGAAERAEGSEPEPQPAGGGGGAAARPNTRGGSALATKKKPQAAKAFGRK